MSEDIIINYSDGTTDSIFDLRDEWNRRLKEAESIWLAEGKTFTGRWCTDCDDYTTHYNHREIKGDNNYTEVETVCLKCGKIWMAVKD